MPQLKYLKHSVVYVPLILIIETIVYSIYAKSGTVFLDTTAAAIWVLCINTPYITYALIRGWRKIDTILALKYAGTASIPMLLPPTLGFIGVDNFTILASTHICVIAAFVTLYYKLKHHLNIWRAMVFCGIALALWYISSDVVSRLRYEIVTTQLPVAMDTHNDISVSNAITKGYDNSLNSFRTKPMHWSIPGKEKELSQAQKEYQILKWLLTEEIQSYINNTENTARYYKRHKELQKFRATDPWAKKWDSLDVYATLNIKRIEYRHIPGKYEIRVRGKETILPKERSKINKAINMDFDYTITICRTQKSNTKNWTIYHIRNNEKE